MRISLCLKRFTKKCVFFCCSDNTKSSCCLDLTLFVESSEFLCKKHQAAIRELINLHGFNSLQHPTYLELYNLLVDSVRKAIWTQVVHFLDGNFVSFMAICEDRPDMTWRRHVARVSVEMAKYFFPHGLSCNPFKYGPLLSFLEEALVPLCKFTLDQFTPPTGASSSSVVLGFV